MKEELIPLSASERWNEALQNVNYAFGHTWESCYAMHLTTGYSTNLYVFQTGDIRIVCPIAERNYNGFIDIVTPYGFSGFVGNYDFPGFPNHWKSFMFNAGYVCGYIGLNPMLVNESYLPKNDLYANNTLYILNLKNNTHDIFQKFSQNRRRQLKDLDKHLEEFTTDKNVLKEFFLSNYHTFFKERNAAQVYNFNYETLSFLLNLENVVIFGFLKEGQVIAVSVFAYTPFGAEYLFNVSSPEGRPYTTHLLWYGIKFLKKINVPYLNLGGGVRDGDSIAKFKQRFGAEEYKLKSLKQVYNQEIYTMLCQEVNVNPDNKEGYFPSYRKPLA